MIQHAAAKWAGHEFIISTSLRCLGPGGLLPCTACITYDTVINKFVKHSLMKGMIFFLLRRASRKKIIQYYETTGLQGWTTLTMCSCKLPQAFLVQMIRLELVLTLVPFSQLHKRQWGMDWSKRKPENGQRKPDGEMDMAIAVSLMPTNN